VHRLDHGLGLDAAPDIRLVGHDDQRITYGLQLAASSRDIGEQPEFIDGLRRVRLAGTNDLDVEGAVTIQKNSGAVFLEA
jgi:hypothetical protein